MQLVNLQRYTPDEFFLGDDVAYFKDETGKDLYKSLPDFTKKFSLAVEHDTGIIFSISDDASKLPWARNGTTIVDVDALPKGCDILGGWVFDGEKVVPRVYTQAELRQQAASQKANLLTAAYEAMRPLEIAVRLGMATDEEKARLEAWEQYIVLVSRITPDDAPNISWPDKPE